MLDISSVRACFSQAVDILYNEYGLYEGSIASLKFNWQTEKLMSMQWVEDLHLTTKFFKKEGEFKAYDMS